MFTLLFRKMRNTKWMVLCLLAGFIMASAMMATIPIFMNASLQRMLVKDLEAFQTEYEIYPGSYNTEYDVPMNAEATDQRSLMTTMREMVESNYNSLGVEADYSKICIADEYLYAKNIRVESGSSAAKMQLAGMTGIEDNIDITQGRMMTAGLNENGAYEAICTERSLQISNIAVGQIYELANVFDNEISVKVEIVGVFSAKDGSEAYWSEGLDDTYMNSVIMDYDTLYNDALDTGAIHITSEVVNYGINYQMLDMSTVDSFLEKIEAQKEDYKINEVTFSLPAVEILSDYGERASQLRLVLWLLQIPIMLMILFYLFMVAQLNVAQEKNEIAIFRSRGASRMQIMGIYALESLVLGFVTAVIGPFVALGLCKILGASNGFLEFVNRTSLPIRLTSEAFIYAGLAVVVFFFTTMIPIIPATKYTIVNHKQSKAKKHRLSWWEKTGVDFILLAGSIAWLIYYNRSQNDLIAQGVTTTETVNPLLFVASTAFILGCGLFIIRIYPFIIRLITFAGKRFWSPAAYVSMNNIGRSSTGREKFLMTFLILTVSLGLFFANTARALNRNAEERVYYSVGADVTLSEEWASSGSTSSSSDSANALQSGAGTDAVEESSDDDDAVINYTEPDFSRYENLTGVESATKVFVRDSVTISSDKMKVPVVQTYTDNSDYDREYFFAMNDSNSTDSTSDCTLMTINPGEFSQVVWSTDRLYPVHINNYLNALSECNYGVILSSSFRDSYGLKLGDVVSCQWGQNQSFSVTVLAFVDSWPSIDPYEKTDSGTYRDFAIMNFDYVQVLTNVEPYEVWLNLEEDASVQDFYDSVEENGLDCETLNVASQQVITEKTDPMLQGMNGALTLGFIIIMIMCIIGFLIYWILSIKSRTLQFGILRAMGMSFKEIIGMLLTEQLLVSGVAIVIAFVVGSVASDLFVPLFQTLCTTSLSYPDFAVIPERSDYLKMYAIIAVMLIFCFAVLGRLISKIKISQALKLGED